MSVAGLEVVLMETRQVKGALKPMPIKTDRRHAEGIARLFDHGWFRSVHGKSVWAQDVRARPCPEPVAIHPGIIDIYSRKIADLAASLNEDSTKAEAADILRSLIEKIILRPDRDAANGNTIELYGELAAILSLCSNGRGTNAKTHASCLGIEQVTMVAGARYQKYLPLYGGCWGESALAVA